MAKANWVDPNGAKVNIEGSAEDIIAILRGLPKLGTRQQPGAKTSSSGKKQYRAHGLKKKKDGPTGLISQLADEGYFKSKRTIGDIQKKLEELGHIYALTSISPILTRLTKKRELRRLKEDKNWVYVF